MLCGFSLARTGGDGQRSFLIPRSGGKGAVITTLLPAEKGTK